MVILNYCSTIKPLPRLIAAFISAASHKYRSGIQRKKVVSGIAKPIWGQVGYLTTKVKASTHSCMQTSHLVNGTVFEFARLEAEPGFGSTINLWLMVQ